MNKTRLRYTFQLIIQSNHVVLPWSASFFLAVEEQKHSTSSNIAIYIVFLLSLSRWNHSTTTKSTFDHRARIMVHVVVHNRRLVATRAES